MLNADVLGLLQGSSHTYLLQLRVLAQLQGPSKHPGQQPWGQVDNALLCQLLVILLPMMLMLMMMLMMMSMLLVMQCLFLLVVLVLLLLGLMLYMYAMAAALLAASLDARCCC